MSRHLALAALCAGLPFIAAAADVKIAGSDLLRPALEKPLAAVDACPGQTLRLSLDGSRSAMEQLRAGTADLAVVAFAPDEPLPTGEFSLLPLAYQVIVFAVNDSNPVRQVSFAQLGGIWGDKEATSIRQWGALGASGVWSVKSIAASRVDDPNSLAGDIFLHTVLRNPEFGSTVLRVASVDELLLKVRVDENCIGLFPGLLRNATGVHMLLVSRDAADVPFGPTPENIHAGDYPVRLPFYIVFNSSRAAELKPVVAALLGDAVAASIEKEGFVAVPDVARSAAIRELAAK